MTAGQTMAAQIKCGACTGQFLSSFRYSDPLNWILSGTE
jgi:hypothetical protein